MYLVNFSVEVHEEDEGDDAEDDEAAPVEVGRVDGVRAEVGGQRADHRVVHRLVGRGVQGVLVLHLGLEKPEKVGIICLVKPSLGIEPVMWMSSTGVQSKVTA